MTIEIMTKLVEDIEGKERKRILRKIEKLDIAEDKPGTFQDGYRCFRDQVVALLKRPYKR